MTLSQWTLGWDPGEQLETGGNLSRAEEKDCASVEGERGEKGTTTGSWY
jgi:hypothetical protein